jgi:CubicO group peptidase (beta-lactamase class C family)
MKDKRTTSVLVFLQVFVMMFLCSQTVLAQVPPNTLDAAASDPKTLGWMQGFPPPADKIIRFIDGSSYRFPQWRWTFSHGRELGPTVNVWHGNEKSIMLPRAEKNLEAVPYTDAEGTKRTWADMLALTYTDGILVLHKGKIVYEKYFGALEPQFQHLGHSATKSFVGTIAAVLAAEGRLDSQALVTKYIPELKDTAYGDATVRQVMDMTIGVKYSENYADPKAEVWDYARAGGLLPTRPDYQGPRTFYDFLVKLQKEGEHGQAFAYKTVNAEVLAWIVRRASGKSLSAYLSERIWQKLGAEYDAYFAVDSIGTEQGGGGLYTSLRDLARFGEMIRLKGRFNDQQIIPATAVEDISRGADKAQFAKADYKTLPGFSYRNMWWVAGDDHGVFMARGIHGQGIYIDPRAEMVIVRYASHPVAGNAYNDPITLPAYRAMADYLMQAPKK